MGKEPLLLEVKGAEMEGERGGRLVCEREKMGALSLPGLGPKKEMRGGARLKHAGTATLLWPQEESGLVAGEGGAGVALGLVCVLAKERAETVRWGTQPKKGSWPVGFG
ncbi:hypothetical protein Peur_014880 [Populus x canadensis]